MNYEMVAMSSSSTGLVIRCYAPVGSSWRPDWGPRPGNLFIDVTQPAEPDR